MMRVFLLFAVAACDDIDASRPGTDLGEYSVSATLLENTCGTPFESADPWLFTIELSQEGDKLYWVQGREPIKGTIDANRFIGGSIGAAVAAPREGKVLLGVRPEHVLVRAAGRFEGTVRGIEPVGEAGYLHLAVDGLEVDTSAAGTSSEPTKKGLLCASVPGRDAFAHREGDVVRFDLAEDRLVLFDPDGGERLG